MRADVLLRRVANELTEAIDRWWLTELTIEEAAEELGISYEAMVQRVRRGSVPNVGRRFGYVSRAA